MERPDVHFAEERTPAGETGLAFLYHYGAPFRPLPEVSDCLVSRPRPWMLIIWEPLQTKAPGPHLTHAFCCYAHTVIFYVRPYIKRPWSRFYRDARGQLRASRGGFEQWDTIDTRLTGDDRYLWQGDRFEAGPGTVFWHRRRWWMRRWARLEQSR